MFIACIGIVIGIIRFSNPNLWGLVLQFLAAKNPAPHKKSPKYVMMQSSPISFGIFPGKPLEMAGSFLANPRKNDAKIGDDDGDLRYFSNASIEYRIKNSVEMFGDDFYMPKSRISCKRGPNKIRERRRSPC